MLLRKRDFVVLALVFVLVYAWNGLLRAQHVTFPNPPTFQCGAIYSFLDRPQYDPTPGPYTPISVSRSTLYFAGWAFQGWDGQHPPLVEASYSDASGTHYLNVALYQGLYRPDVHDALVGSCPNVTNYEGYALYLSNPTDLPLGTIVFHIKQANTENTIQATDNFTLNVQP